jgi:hypothetical protein
MLIFYFTIYNNILSVVVVERFLSEVDPRNLSGPPRNTQPTSRKLPQWYTKNDKTKEKKNHKQAQVPRRIVGLPRSDQG